MDASGLSTSSSTALATSRRLCGGMLVAMPTAMPLEPLTRRLGILEGRTVGSWSRSSKFGLVIDGVLVDVLQHRHGDAGEPRLGVPVGRGGVAVHRAEVALAVDQRIAQREVLHHAHQRVVHRRVAVRMVLAEHVADDRRRLLVRAARHQAELVHRVQDAAVDRLEPVAHVGQRAGDDDAHRVVDERLLHLLFDEARKNALAGVRRGHGDSGLVRKTGWPARPPGTPKYSPRRGRKSTCESRR